MIAESQMVSQLARRSAFTSGSLGKEVNGKPITTTPKEQRPQLRIVDHPSPATPEIPEALEFQGLQGLDACLAESADNADPYAWLVAYAGRFPLLSAHEERCLAETMRAAPGSQAAREARDRMTLANLRLVMRIAQNMWHMAPGIALVDLLQEGVIGLIRAVDGFDPEKGYRFSTYAVWWIAQAIHRSIAQNGHSIYLPVYLFERYRRLKRVHAQLLNQLMREPTIDELLVAYGKHPAHAGKNKAPQVITREELVILMQLQSPTVSLKTPVGPIVNNRGTSAEATVGDLIEDQASTLEFERNEQDADARWMLEIARYALRVGRGNVAQQAQAQRSYEIFVIRALCPKVSLVALGKRYGITRQRVDQIATQANKVVRAALIECGMPAPTSASSSKSSQSSKMLKSSKVQAR